MTDFLLTVLSRTPPWVWAVLALLLALGLRALKPRVITRRQLWAAPLGLGLYAFIGTVQTFGPQALPLLAWALGVGLALAASAGRAPQAQALPDGRVRLAGSVQPLLLYLGVFALRYVLAVVKVAAPAALHPPGLVAGVALVLGASTGLTLARAVFAPRRLLTAPPAAPGLQAA